MRLPVFCKGQRALWVAEPRGTPPTPHHGILDLRQQRGACSSALAQVRRAPRRASVSLAPAENESSKRRRWTYGLLTIVLAPLGVNLVVKYLPDPSARELPATLDLQKLPPLTVTITDAPEPAESSTPGLPPSFTAHFAAQAGPSAGSSEYRGSGLGTILALSAGVLALLASLVTCHLFVRAFRSHSKQPQTDDDDAGRI